MKNCMMSVTTSTVVKIMPNRVKDITLYFSFNHLKTKESHIFLLFIKRYFVSTLEITLTFQWFARIFLSKFQRKLQVACLIIFFCVIRSVFVQFSFRYLKSTKFSTNSEAVLSKFQGKLQVSCLIIFSCVQGGR